MNHAFEFTDSHKIVPIGSKGDDFPIVGASADLFRAPEPPAPARAQAGKRIAKKDKPLNIVKAAKQRLKDVEREIKRLRALEKERDELRRLLDAAINQPRAAVRDISAAKRG